MNRTDNLKLLRDYAECSDEAAFRELVERYIDLVYSTAIRRVGGDAGLAEDVTQTVFTDLARKARSLRDVELLGGWLHRHTGFVAATMVRSQQRREAREKEAAQMKAFEDSPDSLWQQLEPVLDDSLEDLEPPDRQAILLRFFERRDFRSIGVALGVSDDAAQKRVGRALEKLRELLLQRGVTLSLVLLGTLMAGRVIKAAPSGLATHVAQAALAGATVGSGLAVAVAKLAHSLGFKLLLGGAAVVVAVCLYHAAHSTPAQSPARQENSAALLAGPSNGPARSSLLTTAAPAFRSEYPNATRHSLLLAIVADDGRPVPDVTLEYWFFRTNKVTREKPLQSTRFGLCEIPVPEDLVRLVVVSEKDGFADTSLDWRPDRGEKIPAEYSLRLGPAVPIGGSVVDPEAKPVAGAEVSFGNEPDPAAETRPQSDDFGWPYGVRTTTDAQGRWQIDRIGKAALHTVSASASHPDYVQARMDSSSHNPEAQRQLLTGTYVFTLGHAVTVRGVVKDPDGRPVPDARVLVGHLDESKSRQTTNHADGSFFVAGCAPGKNLITAEARGYAATTMEVELADDSAPFRLTLRPGGLLKLHVTDPNGNPVPKAMVYYDQFGSPGQTSAAAQAGFQKQTDGDGRLEWDTAPDQELYFDFSAAGFMRADYVKLRPDGTEHAITLQPALTISGTVNDAVTGLPIPRFRIITGWPNVNPVDHTTNAQWSTIDRFWLSFTDGAFRNTYEEAALAGTSDPKFMFKIEAVGHASFITRAVAASEREVHFDVALTPASTTQVTVLSPDGDPAAGADVGLVCPGVRLELVPGGLSRNNVQSGGSLLLTDAQGRFQLPPDPTVVRVVAASPQGYAEAPVADLVANPRLQMQPWGRLEGIYQVGGQPVADRQLLFQCGPENGTDISSDFNAFQIKTDSDGRFAFPQVPPGEHELDLVVPLGFGPNQGWTFQPLQKLTVRPGETNTVTVGGSN